MNEFWRLINRAKNSEVVKALEAGYFWEKDRIKQQERKRDEKKMEERRRNRQERKKRLEEMTWRPQQKWNERDMEHGMEEILHFLGEYPSHQPNNEKLVEAYDRYLKRLELVDPYPNWVFWR